MRVNATTSLSPTEVTCDMAHVNSRAGSALLSGHPGLAAALQRPAAPLLTGAAPAGTGDDRLAGLLAGGLRPSGLPALSANRPLTVLIQES
jgi:hypothetical protein